jgi:hypothetical protein
MDLTGTNRQIDAMQDWLVLNGSAQIANLKQYRGVRANHRLSEQHVNEKPAEDG